MKRATLVVDGFNLYHSIDSLNDNRLKWVSLVTLGQTIIRSRTESLDQTGYFSAIAHHRAAKDPDSPARHTTYISALEAIGAKVILGNFKRKNRRCLNCKTSWVSHEEKETDVNIALWLLLATVRHSADVIYLLSADTDLVPAVQTARAENPQIEFVGVFPPALARNTKQLQTACHRDIRLTQNHITKARLSDPVIAPDGTSIACPAKYR